MLKHDGRVRRVENPPPNSCFKMREGHGLHHVEMQDKGIVVGGQPLCRVFQAREEWCQEEM